MKKTELAVRLTNACTCVSEAEDILTEIDSKFGDADHGLTMTKIAKAISQAVAEADGGIQSMLDAAAMAVMMLNGGNVVKSYYCDGFERVAAACPVPIVIAGGKKLPESEVLEMAYKAIQEGAHGVDMGRNIFQSDCPAGMAQAIAKVVHEGYTAAQAFEIYETVKHQR